MEHHEYRDMIRRLFEKELDPVSDRRLFAHLRECESCERAYERYSSAERAFAGDSSTSDRVLARVLGPASEAPARSLGWRFVLPAVLALGLVVVTFRPPPADFAARGGAAEVSSAMRVLVIRIEDGQPQVSDLVAGGEVRAGDRLRILCSAVAPMTIASVAIEAPSGERVAIASAVALPAGAVEAPIGDVVEVTPAWGHGDATLRAGEMALTFTVAGE